MKPGIISITLFILSLLLSQTFDRAGRASAEDNHFHEDSKHEGHDHFEIKHSDHEGHNHDEIEHSDHEGHDHDEIEHSDHEGHDHDEIEHGDHGGHDHDEIEPSDHGDDGHDDAQHITLSREEISNLGISTQTAGWGRLKSHIVLQGEVRMNGDYVARVVPRVPGIVKKVVKILGDKVKTGEVMAVLESKELADARADFHASNERLSLAMAGYTREQRLWKKKISSEQEYLDSKQGLVEAQIDLRLAEQKLIAMGMSSDFLQNFPHDPDESFTLYNIIAPFDGTVVEKDITLGEVLDDKTLAFIVANLDSVWVDLSVYQKDLPFIRHGQKVMISAGIGVPDTEGTISYVGPLLEDTTRKTLARVILPNPIGIWRPGLFVTAQIIESGDKIPVLIPKSAIQKLEGKSCVFIKTNDEFLLKNITVGRTDKTHAEIISGLKAGQSFVDNGAFELKAKIVTSTMDSHAGHGH